MRVWWCAVVLPMAVGCGYSGFESVHEVSKEHADALTDAAPYEGLTPPVDAARPATVEIGPDGRAVIKLDVHEACRLALRNNLQYLVQGEQLDIQLLTLDVIRHTYGPLATPFSGSGAYTQGNRADGTGSQSVSLGVNQRLPFGGTAGANYTHTGAQLQGPNAYQGTLALSITQPLLRGAGHRAAMEEIVSAGRNYRYARRAYEFGRLSLLISTVEAFFGLLQQQAGIRNFESALFRTQQLARQADIRERFGLVTRTDVFRSQLEVTRSESTLSTARQQFELAVNAFKVDLGIPPEAAVVLVFEGIVYKPLATSRDEAVELALANNPDWLTANDRFEDARRQLALASNAVLPQVDVIASYTLTSDVERELIEGYEMDTAAWSIGGAFSIPLDRTALRRDYQAAVIGYRQAERDFARARDRVARDVDSLLILMRQSEMNIDFQQRAINDAEKAALLAEYDYRRGRATNRDVIEAQDRLTEAKNTLNIARVNAHVVQLRLRQFIGRLEADDQGRLK